MSFRTHNRTKLFAAAAALLLLSSTGAAQTLVSGFGSTTLSGVAGGSERAVRFGNTAEGMCQGWISSSPNHTIELTSATSLTLRVNAPSDTTLVVRGPDGTHCNDDGGQSHNPAISGRFPAGSYQVYIGSYEEGQSIRYTLTVGE
ncbi:MAG: hypothetical protein ACJAYU_002751 [Bradymonadia bacterium]|jgi:hypothetical protein